MNWIGSLTVSHSLPAKRCVNALSFLLRVLCSRVLIWSQSVLRHKSKEKLLIAIAYYTALRRLHVSITKASAPDSSLATLSSVTAHTHAAASVNMGPMATVFEL